MKRILLLCFFLSLGIIALILSKKDRSKTIPVPLCTDCNIVLIDIDPLRMDALHTFGNPRKATPFLDSFAAQNYSFTNAVAVSSWTLPSAMSLLTGTYAYQHGIINKVILRDSDKSEYPASLAETAPSFRTLAEELKTRGYETAGFAGGAALDPSYGFHRGFDIYESPGEFEDSSVSLHKAIDFMKEHKNSKFFVFVHGFDVHGQKIPSDGLDRRYVDPNYHGSLTGSAAEQKAIREEGVLQENVFLGHDDVSFLRAIYDEKVNRMDGRISEFYEKLKQLDLQKNTIILFTSNHGEEFYEHGRIDHGMTLYDEVVRVPLIIHIPDGTPTQITQQVRNIDIAPTLLSLVGIDPSATFSAQTSGKSLLPMLSGKIQRLNALLETSYRYATFKKALRTFDGWKLIFDEEHGTKELYDIGKSKDESQNLAGKNSSKEAALSDIMNKTLHQNILP